MKVRSCLLAILLLAAGTDGARAQLPGGPLVGPARMRYEFVQRLQLELTTYMREWERGWGPRQRYVRRLRDHYTSDAVILTGEGTLIRGRNPVRRFADAMRDQAAEAFTSMADFDASHDVAFVYGPYAITPRAGAGTPDNGLITGVLFKDRDRWRYRVQMFMPRDTALMLRTGGGETLMPPYALDAKADQNARRRYSEAVTTSALLRFAWNQRDVESIRKLLSDNPMILFPGADGPVRGSALESELPERMAELGTWTASVVDFDTRARISYLVGRYHMAARGGPRVGVYLMVVTDEDGEPRLRALIFN